MSNLRYRQEKIKEERKYTPFKQYIKEIASWLPIGFSKNSGFISRFPVSGRVKIVSQKQFEENQDDLIKNGREYDFSKDFFSNFGSLFRTIPFPNMFVFGDSENSEYADVVLNSRNAYLSSTMIGNCENVCYSILTRTHSKNVFNSLFSVEYTENVYFSAGTIHSFNIFYSSFINNSNNIWFSSNLNGCSECLFCDNLDNVSYYIYNKAYEKQDYLKEKERLLKDKTKFEGYLLKISRRGNNSPGTDVHGSFILDSDNIKNGNYVYNTKDARNVFFVGSTGGNKDFLDAFPGGGGTVACNDFYGICGAGDGSSHLYCSSQIGSSSNIFYSYYLTGCSYCIGCIGLKNQSYCIFNKKYSKEDWEELSDKIFGAMEKDGLIGKFFPGSINPFNLNDTFAGVLGGFSKQDALEDGYLWRDKEIKTDIPDGYDTVGVDKIKEYQGYDKDGIWRINPEIMKKVIVDNKGNYYRIVKMEYDFLLKHFLPIPEIHRMDRVKVNLGVYK